MSRNMIVVVLVAVLGLIACMGSDCDIDIDQHGGHGWTDYYVEQPVYYVPDPYYYEPVVYCDSWYCW